jgi:hypothetical protein
LAYSSSRSRHARNATGISGDDEYFAASIAVRLEVENNPIVQARLPAIIRGLELAGKTGHTGSMLSTLESVTVELDDGTQLETGGFTPDDDRYTTVWVAPTFSTDCG